MQFRQQALAKLQSPEELDLPVRFARPQGWLVLPSRSPSMAAASVWAVTGSVTSTVGAPAILTHGEGSYVLQSPVAGQVTAVLAKEGERLPANSPVLKVRTADGRHRRPHGRRGPAHRAGRHHRADHLAPARTSPPWRRSPTPPIRCTPRSTSRPRTRPPFPRRRRGPDGPVGAHPAVRRAARPCEVGGPLGPVGQQIAGSSGTASCGEQFTKDGRPVAVLVRLDKSSAHEERLPVVLRRTGRRSRSPP